MHILFLAVVVSICSCNKEDDSFELDPLYANYEGRYYWYKSQYTVDFGGGYFYTNSTSLYLYDLFPLGYVRIKSNGEVLAEGQINEMEISNDYISFQFVDDDGLKYNSQLINSDSLWYKLNGPGPLSPAGNEEYQWSYFKKE